MDYVAVIETTSTGFSAYVPDAPGCIATGATREEVLTNLTEALHLHFEGLREDGLPIPVPSTQADLVPA